ncbi:MerR family transcriptional regulator [Flavobacteriaceae bacterium Ap0902]|nr:MerR family transcriptional regulator [Flavobacteriaceae bacterium Ap0902]
MQIDLPDKLYYSIGEVARAFGVNTSLIRFWEKEFDIIKPKKNKKGNRYFTKEDIKNLKTIYHLVKERGYTLEGANTVLKEQNNLDNEIELIFRLEKVKADLTSLKSYFDDIAH